MNRHILIVLLALAPASVFPCSRPSPVDPVEMVKHADLIVVARALEYARPPADPRVRTTGTPDSLIHFEVNEWVKGKGPLSLTLPGYLVDRDDFNDQTSPYKFVRRNGRSGSCFANSYRVGAEFLLILKLRGGEYTPDWYALGPTNEQLRDADDPWLKWVREQVRPIRAAPN